MSKVYKTLLMLNTSEHEIDPACKCENATTVYIYDYEQDKYNINVRVLKQGKYLVFSIIVFVSK